MVASLYLSIDSKSAKGRLFRPQPFHAPQAPLRAHKSGVQEEQAEGHSLGDLSYTKKDRCFLVSILLSTEHLNEICVVEFWQTQASATLIYTRCTDISNRQI